MDLPPPESRAKVPMFLSQADLKRPHAAHLPTPAQMAAVFKKPRILGESANSPAATPASLPHILQPLLLLTQCVPANIYPVVSEPFAVSDFFVDVETNHSQKYSDQMKLVLAKFPPPIAPAKSSNLPYNGVGIMVPFVYPPIPVLRPDAYLADPPITKKRGRKSASQLLAIANANLSSHLGVENVDFHPVMAPLPFPPPNYMSYPLISDQSTLTPNEVFSSWIAALEHLPRSDMVVASAAGSIFDLRAQAEADGLTVAKLDRIVQLSRHESDPEAEDDRSDSEELILDSGYEDYAEYADQVDISTAYDPHAQNKHIGKVVVDLPIKTDFVQVSPLVSSQGRTLAKRPAASFEYSDRDIEEQTEFAMPETVVTNGARDITNAVGAQKERRRQELLQSVREIEDFASANRDEIYASKKLALLARLRTLQQSKISFDDSKTLTDDRELDYYLTELQARRDMDLLRLKMYHTYEKLKCAYAFYHTSNKAYKNMNFLMINKLQKLRNFFEYQRQVFHDATNLKNESDVFNIRSKESAKTYNGFTENDYLGAIKEIFRESVVNEDKGLPLDSHPNFDSAQYSKVFTDREHQANVHDMMPLVTEEEFKLIVGDAPQKAGPTKDANGKTKSARHPIFQSLLYDPVTSGSDTNGSDGGAPTFKRRPGRRAAPKPVFGDSTAKQNTEAALVAKIMKQFIGPAAASADELSNDLELIGIETRWPVK